MADNAKVLSLTPLAQSYALAPRNRTDSAERVDSGGDQNSHLRRFRFRVYESGKAQSPDTEKTAGKTAGKTTGKTTGKIAANASRPGRIRLAGGNASNATAQRAATAAPASGANQTFRTNAQAPSSAFLAQSIAQEQLGQGLHNPPFAAAAAAYGQANAALGPQPSAGLDLSA